ncbi:reprolysin-like metallopeptidase [Nocardioides sp.]|uniref:reprolysin-like metallopeptidase n=1 Tax=Nocardioides sp. TaxID=35761 RepID=UPI0035661317
MPGRPLPVRRTLTPVVALLLTLAVLPLHTALAATAQATTTRAATSGPVAARIGEAPGAQVVRRTYRLALVNDPSYAAAVAPGATTGAESNAAVLAAKQALVTRLNEVFSADLAIRFELAPGIDTLNLRTAALATEANGPCGTEPCFTPEQLSTTGVGCTDDLTGRNRYVLGQLIGAHSYDIGHLLLGFDAGSISSAAAAGTQWRGRGCSGSSAPTGDGFVLDLLAHELAHQLGASDSYDGVDGDCGLDLHGEPLALEPGSGSSIMGLAGRCGEDDLQAHADPWFSTWSQDEIGRYVTGQSDFVPIDATAAEVQSVSLKNFDGTDSFKLRFNGVDTAVITRGSNYSESGIKNALNLALSQLDPPTTAHKVRSFWQTGEFDERGFEITYLFDNVVTPTLIPVSGTFTAAVNDIDEGGLQRIGGTTTTTANRNPVVTVPASKTIPVRTPFALTGSATDADADPLTYQWQQLDVGDHGQALADQPRLNGPLFRLLAPTTSPTRVFPDLAQVLADNTTAATGTCPPGPQVGDCLAERLPTADYANLDASTPTQLHFSLVARDRNALGGGVAYGDLALTLDKSTGPFRVTSQGSAVSLVGGSSQQITWTANTAALAANVKISLSTDGGQTFPTVLAASTPNDGNHQVTLPEVETTTARIKVEALGNYFFDVNRADFSILPAPSGLTVTGMPTTAGTQHSDPLTLTFSASSGNGASDLLAASITSGSLPAGLALAKADQSGPGIVPGTAQWNVTGTATGPPGDYPIQIEVSDGVASRTSAVTVTVTADSGAATYTGPTEVAAPSGGPDAVEIPLSAEVTQVADATPGHLDTATLTFKDATTGQVLCADVPVVASGTDPGTASCDYAADLPAFGGRTYQVVLVLGGSWAGGSAGPTPVVVTSPEPGPAPETTITAAPGRWLLDANGVVGFTSDQTDATFVCTLDGAAHPCGDSALALGRLGAGTHRVTVAARNSEGTLDPTPAAVDFTVPHDDRALRMASGKWRRKHAAAAYEDTFTKVKGKNAKLTYRVKRATRIALIVSTAPKHGKVKVYLGRTLLAKVRLKGDRRWQDVVEVAAFERPRSGLIKIVTTNRKQVRIDGLGVVTD